MRKTAMHRADNRIDTGGETVTGALVRYQPTRVHGGKHGSGSEQKDRSPDEPNDTDKQCKRLLACCLLGHTNGKKNQNTRDRIDDERCKDVGVHGSSLGFLAGLAGAQLGMKRLQSRKAGVLDVPVHELGNP